MTKKALKRAGWSLLGFRWPSNKQFTVSWLGVFNIRICSDQMCISSRWLTISILSLSSSSRSMIANPSCRFAVSHQHRPHRHSHSYTHFLRQSQVSVCSNPLSHGLEQFYLHSICLRQSHLQSSPPTHSRVIMFAPANLSTSLCGTALRQCSIIRI